MSVASNLGYEVANWNLDTNDWRNNHDTAPILNSLHTNDYAAPDGNDSKIVLLHDRLITVKALDSIIKFYKDKGMQFVNLETCLGVEGYF